MKLWKDYFEELLNVPEGKEVNEETKTYEGPQPNVEEPTMKEMDDALKHMKNNKAPGTDGMAVELLKQGGEACKKALYRLILQVWRNEKMPNEWQQAVICPIYKKGKRTKCENYRGISLLCSAYKILARILLHRLLPYIEENLEEHQAGFRKGMSTTDQIFILRQVIEKTWEFDKKLYCLFIDFKKAYDSVNRESIWRIMEESGIPSKLIGLTRMCIEKTECKVRVEGRESECFTVETGVKQGDCISPSLFNLVLEKALKKASSIGRGTIVGDEVKLLAFADDIVVLAEEEEELKRTAKVLIEEAQRVGLRINQDKTECMIVTRHNKEETEGVLAIEDMEFRKTRSFKYLGSTVNTNNNMEEEVMNRIKSAERCLFSVNKLFTSRLLTKTTKLRIYKTIVRPVLMYGAETWTLSKKMERKIITFENKVLRKVFGPVSENGIFRRRKNIEIHTLFNEPDVTAVIKSRRIEWLGHVLRREEKMVKTVLEGKPQGTRPLGRPKLRWMDGVKKDLETLGANEDMASNRDQWKRLKSEAMNRLRFVWPAK